MVEPTGQALVQSGYETESNLCPGGGVAGTGQSLAYLLISRNWHSRRLVGHWPTCRATGHRHRCDEPEPDATACMPEAVARSTSRALQFDGRCSRAFASPRRRGRRLPGLQAGCRVNPVLATRC